MNGLQGKVAIVTGASRGIGAATATVLASKGAKVVVNYLRNIDDAVEVVSKIEGGGGTATAVQADVSKPDGIEKLFAETMAAYGRLDILVNNAGPLQPASLDQITDRLMDDMLNLNFKSVASCTKAAAALFPATGGVVVNISSETVRNILPGSAVFAAAKSAAQTLTRYLAQELGPRGIRVVGVSPGYTLTPATSGLHREVANLLVSRTALRRPGRPNDIAPVVAFLASDEGAWITGTTLAVSGGLNL